MRLQELIREEVNFVLRYEIADARLQNVAITFVELAGDGSCARLWFTTEDNPSKDGDDPRGQATRKDPSEALARASGYFRNHLATALALKRTPELRFRPDPASRTAAALGH